MKQLFKLSVISVLFLTGIFMVLFITTAPPDKKIEKFQTYTYEKDTMYIIAVDYNTVTYIQRNDTMHAPIFFVYEYCNLIEK